MSDCPSDNGIDPRSRSFDIEIAATTATLSADSTLLKAECVVFYWFCPFFYMHSRNRNQWAYFLCWHHQLHWKYLRQGLFFARLLFDKASMLMQSNRGKGFCFVLFIASENLLYYSPLWKAASAFVKFHICLLIGCPCLFCGNHFCVNYVLE